MSTIGTHSILSLELIQAAHERIRDKIRRTPVMTSRTLDELSGARLFFKCENLQSAGAFKARGATNAVFSLSETEASRGVITHSSGNHGAALARAARLRGIPCFVVMPANAPAAKKAAVKRYGGEIVLCDANLDAREQTARRLAGETRATLIHAYDDPRVLAGQGTTGIEFLEEVPDLEYLFCAIGGGGHLAGIAVAAKSLSPRVQVIGVEPAGADDAARSFRSGRLIPADHPKSIADGLLASLSDRTFALIRAHVSDVITVPEDAIVSAMRRVWEIMKLVVEPSGVVAYAGAHGTGDPIRGKRVGIVLSGGNLDLDRLPWQPA